MHDRRIGSRSFSTRGVLAEHKTFSRRAKGRSKYLKSKATFDRSSILRYTKISNEITAILLCKIKVLKSDSSHVQGQG
jgi:hypothetical protein